MPTKILWHVLKSSSFFFFLGEKCENSPPQKNTANGRYPIGYNGFFILESLISKSIIIPRCIFECKEKTIERVNFMTLVDS